MMKKLNIDDKKYDYGALLCIHYMTYEIIQGYQDLHKCKTLMIWMSIYAKDIYSLYV